MSHMGNNQEDCIIVRDDLKVFDCFRFYTIRAKIEVAGVKKKDYVINFYPVKGDPDPDDDYLGTLVCVSPKSNCKMKVSPVSSHIRLVTVTDVITKIYFNKSPFEIIQYNLSQDMLAVSVEQCHVSETGDKLCSFHGQKGVIRKEAKMPSFAYDSSSSRTVPDLLVNPYSIFRMTPGQIKEGLEMGDGRDAVFIYNSDGECILYGIVFVGKIFYFSVSYWSNEHIYTPRKEECVVDKISGQAVKGRSRGGGMRAGNMELMNGMRGNGIAACFEEKMIEHGDYFITEEGILLPKSALLCREDARFFKCNMTYEAEPVVMECVEGEDMKVKVKI